MTIDPSDVLRLVVGLGSLLGGAQGLVWGASRLATSLRIPPVVIGLTVVAFGTSSPELAASVTSARSGNPGLAVGNVVGSNIFNVLVILGLAALVSPLRVDRRLVRLDVPIMVGVTLAAFALAFDGAISSRDGWAMIVMLAGYLGWLLWEAKRQKGAGDPAPPVSTKGSVGLAALAAFVGLGFLTLGATWLVDGATAVAQRLGVSHLLIGLTVVAAGTSLPELAASVMASLRGERDLAVGNVVGSNIFNLLAVLGVTGVFSRGGIEVAPSALSFDMVVMIAVSLACLPVLFSGLEIERWEGALFLLVYALYARQLYLTSTAAMLAPSLRWLISVLAGGVLASVVRQRWSERGA